VTLSVSIAVVGLAAILGAIVGSFLNVVISRVPEGGSIVRPRSRCPICLTEIGPRDNIPVVSYLILRGRCRTCRTPIPSWYPLVEISTAAIWAIAAWVILNGPATAIAYALMSLVIATALIALTVIDLHTHRLPRVIVLPLYAVVVVGIGSAALTGDSGDAWGLVLGAVIWTAFLGVLWWGSRGRGMGFGDVTLAPVLGASLGWQSIWVSLAGLLAAFIIGAVVAGVLLISGRASRRSRIPFGPFLAAGWAVALMVGQWAWDVYSAGLAI